MDLVDTSPSHMLYSNSVKLRKQGQELALQKQKEMSSGRLAPASSTGRIQTSNHKINHEINTSFATKTL